MSGKLKTVAVSYQYLSRMANSIDFPVLQPVASDAAFSDAPG